MNGSAWTEPASTNERFELLRSLYQISREQRKALAENRLDSFAALLQEREALIEEFGRLNAAPAAMEPEPLQPDNIIPFPGTVVPVGLTPVYSDDDFALQSLLHAILHVDAENEQMLQHELRELRESIGQVGRARLSIRSYRPTVSALLTAVDERA